MPTCHLQTVICTFACAICFFYQLIYLQSYNSLKSSYAGISLQCEHNMTVAETTSVSIMRPKCSDINAKALMTVK